MSVKKCWMSILFWVWKLKQIAELAQNRVFKFDLKEFPENEIGALWAYFCFEVSQ